MNLLKLTIVVAAICGAIAMPSVVDAKVAADPNGTFVDSFGTSFAFSLCGDGSTQLCGVLKTLKGQSATKVNLAFVGKQVMQAVQTGPNEWKGSLKAGGISADATLTMTTAKTIDIRGCRSVFCQTLTYTRT
jgi:hypothetical protein